MQNDSEETLKKILNAMSFTDLDLLDEYSEFISKSNKNGISQAVWARRSDILVDHFKNNSDIKVLHIKRSSLWQIDPILNLKTGILYLLFSENNLEKVKKDFINKGSITHYAYQFLKRSLVTEHIEGNNIELLPIEEDNQEIESNREKEIHKMLGSFSNEFKDVVFVSVAYYDKTAISASIKKFTPNFKLAEEQDISNLLSVAYKGDTTSNSEFKRNNVSIHDKENIPLVKLKETIKTNE